MDEEVVFGVHLGQLGVQNAQVGLAFFLLLDANQSGVGARGKDFDRVFRLPVGRIHGQLGGILGLEFAQPQVFALVVLAFVEPPGEVGMVPLGLQQGAFPLVLFAGGQIGQE